MKTRYLILALLLVGSCTSNRPLLPSYTEPIEYFFAETSLKPKAIGPLKAYRLDDNFSALGRILHSFKEGNFDDHLDRLLVYEHLYYGELDELAAFLAFRGDFYWLSMEPGQKVDVLDVLEKLCNPLNDRELLFLMQPERQARFSDKILDVLLLVLHERILRSGATPKYADYFSPKIAQIKEGKVAPPLREQLIRVKENQTELIGPIQGFWACRQ